jgi:Uma2 family endonuclease
VQRLAYWIDDQLPDDLTAVIDIEVTVTASFPPIVRAPDVVITRSSSVSTGKPRLSALDMLCAIEVISPGSSRTDPLVKPVEYAEAGIPAYWLVDPDTPATIIAHSLAAGEYHADAEVSGTFSTSFPAPITINLNGLTPRRSG